MNTEDQNRAKQAYDQYKEKYDQADEKVEFESSIKKLPATILTCGLVQTLAFYQKKDARTLLDAWLKSKWERLFGWQEAQEIQNTDRAQFLGRICSIDIEGYRMLRDEAMVYATWLKRAAEYHGE